MKAGVIYVLIRPSLEKQGYLREWLKRWSCASVSSSIRMPDWGANWDSKEVTGGLKKRVLLEQKTEQVLE